MFITTAPPKEIIKQEQSKLNLERQLVGRLLPYHEHLLLWSLIDDLKEAYGNQA